MKFCWSKVTNDCIFCSASNISKILNVSKTIRQWYVSQLPWFQISLELKSWRWFLKRLWIEIILIDSGCQIIQQRNWYSTKELATKILILDRLLLSWWIPIIAQPLLGQFCTIGSDSFYGMYEDHQYWKDIQFDEFSSLASAQCQHA